MTGAERIAAERATHEAKGWTIDHDLSHGVGDLTDAAVAFVWNDPSLIPWEEGCQPAGNPGRSAAERAHDLIVAGALIAAELDCMIARGEVE